MKFGPVSLTQAVGHILAHSVALPNKRLRKGIVLTRDHILDLDAAGVTSITTAQLDETDVHEDAAATNLAQAIVGENAPGIRLTPATTGRVNLVATGAGVVRLHVPDLIKSNRVDPNITVATVPDLHQMAAGGLIATVKIISYGVDQTALDKACNLAQNAIELIEPIHKTASLIFSHTSQSQDAKGVDAIRARCDALGIELENVLHAAHDENELAQVLSQITSDVILILSDTATSDVFDTAPQAVRYAGGTVMRFGMPVDPGNLLFLGALGERPVIGLPGCARSIALNGADWVLSRVACGIDITDQDFAQMAIGGLLKEIPTRPHPRRSRET